MRPAVRTKSGSPITLRSRPSAWLTAGWPPPSASAAREAERVTNSASNVFKQIEIELRTMNRVHRDMHPLGSVHRESGT